MKQYLSHPIKWITLAGLSLLSVLILSACQPAAPIPVTAATTAPTQPPAATATSAPTATTAPAVAEPTVNLASDPSLGSILVDGKGMTLYIFTKDGPDTSNCDAACLAKWPPLLTGGSPIAGKGVDDGKLGAAGLADGRLIVTYNHMPLYTWVGDAKAGDTTGQNVGKVWFVVSPDGKAVMQAPPPADDSGNDTGYGDDNPKGGDDTPAASSSEPTLNVTEDKALGKFLVDGKGMTLYLFTRDTKGVSNCSGGCLSAWPPLLTGGKPNLGPGVDAAKVGAAKLADGSLIVTYDGMPLYYYAQDKQPGDTTGQGVGGVWYVVAP